MMMPGNPGRWICLPRGESRSQHLAGAGQAAQPAAQKQRDEQNLGRADPFEASGQGVEPKARILETKGVLSNSRNTRMAASNAMSRPIWSREPDNRMEKWALSAITADSSSYLSGARQGPYSDSIKSRM